MNLTWVGSDERRILRKDFSTQAVHGTHRQRVTAEDKQKQQAKKHTGLRQGRGWGAVEGLFLLEEELVPFKQQVKINTHPSKVANDFNPSSTCEAEKGPSLIWKPADSVYPVLGKPRLHSKILSPEEKTTTKH